MKNRVNDKTEQGLMKLLQDKREELRSFHFSMSGAKIKNVKLARNTRKQIARTLTALQEIRNK
ncbi:MAG: 50S ribosomal protein L29 [Patescibacteria group bacterium]